MQLYVPMCLSFGSLVQLEFPKANIWVYNICALCGRLYNEIDLKHFLRKLNLNLYGFYKSTLTEVFSLQSKET